MGSTFDVNSLHDGARMGISKSGVFVVRYQGQKALLLDRNVLTGEDLEIRRRLSVDQTEESDFPIAPDIWVTDCIMDGDFIFPMLPVPEDLKTRVENGELIQMKPYRRRKWRDPEAIPMEMLQTDEDLLSEAPDAPEKAGAFAADSIPAPAPVSEPAAVITPSQETQPAQIVYRSSLREADRPVEIDAEQPSILQPRRRASISKPKLTMPTITMPSLTLPSIALPAIRPRLPRSRNAIILGGGAVAAMLITVMVPSTKVDLVVKPHDASLQTEVVAGTSENADVHMRFASPDKPVTLTETFKVTGSQITPGTSAKTSVVFTNSCPAQVVPVAEMFQGEQLRTASGVVFKITDAYATAPAGQKSLPVAVAAVNPGPAGNVDAGQITQIDNVGSLKDCLTVTNPAPASGGTAGVSLAAMGQNDAGNARAQMQKDLDTAINKALVAQERPGETVVDEPMKITNFEVDHLPGDTTGSFTATITGTARGDFYIPKDVQNSFLQKFMDTKVGSARKIYGAQPTVDYALENPSKPGELKFKGTVAAEVILNPDRGAVAWNLKLQSPGDARKYLVNTLGADDATISQDGLQIPGHLPLNPWKIDVEINGK